MTRQTAPRAPDTAWGQPRARLGWSLRELAAATGINAGELSRIERGRSCPTPDQARRLLAAFDAPEPESAVEGGPALTAYARDYAAIRDRGDEA